ncbi:ADP-ribosylglycohydrolase family protein [bacterium]|nr:ADP-ribosylglycohydrolase family protein [bacterium]
MKTTNLPPDHEERIARARLSLDGLSVGDSYGTAVELYGPTQMDGVRWPFTDDTVMAINIVRVLSKHGRIDQDELAEAFALSYINNPRRGYGAGTARLLGAVACGENWRPLSRASFGGGGSMGNGGAMRVAPLGAYFADDIDTLIEQARLSAEVTHAHPEAQAGTIAVALAAAWAWHWNQNSNQNPRGMIEHVIQHTPKSETRDGLIDASNLPLDHEAIEAAEKLGNGSNILAQDTVPLAIWMAARHLGDYPYAIIETARCGGDVDTNCAIVGGIVALSAGADSIPIEWLRLRERFFE